MNPEPLTKNAFPPGGWVYLQPQTGWRPPTPFNSTFAQTVELIMKHRLANPAITAKHQLALGAEAIEQELMAYNMKRLNIQAEAQSPPKPLPLSASAALSGGRVAEEVKRLGIGVGVLKDWLGDDCDRVEVEAATARAEVCLQCPNNIPGNIIQKLEGTFAEVIRKTVELKKNLSLRTPLDDRLYSCQACNCHLGLKVWIPSKTIRERTPEEDMAVLQSVVTRDGRKCWIVSEQ